jgi:hypothetical protein
MDSFSEGNKSTPPPKTPASSLLAVPNGIEEFRRDIFNLDKEIKLSTEEFDAKWPYLDNLFILNKTRMLKKGIVTRYWPCRLHPHKPYQTKVQLGKRQRNRTARIQLGCPYIIWSDHEGGIVKLTRSSNAFHNHDIIALDYKNSTAVRKTLQEEVEKGYQPPDISNNLANPRNGNLEALKLAGGNNVITKAVSNAGLAWRRENPDTRILVHDVAAPIQVDDAI